MFKSMKIHKVIVAGSLGVGKTSLINAILEVNAQIESKEGEDPFVYTIIDGIPTQIKFIEHPG
jgi:predicted GTPase